MRGSFQTCWYWMWVKRRRYIVFLHNSIMRNPLFGLHTVNKSVLEWKTKKWLYSVTNKSSNVLKKCDKSLIKCPQEVWKYVQMSPSVCSTHFKNPHAWVLLSGKSECKCPQEVWKITSNICLAKLHFSSNVLKCLLYQWQCSNVPTMCDISL